MATYGEMVPGETCFSLNFAVPAPATNGDSTLAGAFGSSPSTAASSPAPLASTVNDPKNRPLLPNGKKTKGRVKIKMEFIDNKLRRYTTFSKRKTGIMKKAYELSTLTGTQVMLLVASETGHVYTFATKKLQPMITSDAGKALIQTCLNTPETGADGSSPSNDNAGVLSTNFHTSEITPNANGSSSSRKKARHSQQGLTFSLNDTPLKGSSKSSLFYNSTSASMSDLPTMVQPTSIFSSSGSSGLRSSGSDEEDEDAGEDEEMTPSPRSPLVEQSTSGQHNVIASLLEAAMSGNTAAMSGNGSAKGSKSSKQQSAVPNPLFPFASFIPATSTSQSQQQAFGFLPGLTANGAFMYQMPQGLMYAPALSMGDGSTTAAQQNFMFTQAGDSAGQVGQQQFITIPVPMSLTQSMLASQLLGNMAADGSKIKASADDDQSD